MSALLTQFKAARRVSVPLIAINTPDPTATISHIAQSLNGNAPALTQWDAVRGLTPLNDAGAGALAQLGTDDIEFSANPVSAYASALRLEAGAILFLHNAPRVLQGGEALKAIQAVCNLRDPFASNRRTLVMLGPSFSLPAELCNDVLLLDEPLPDGAQLEKLVDAAHEDAGLPLPKGDARTGAVSALLGLAQFPAEQVSAMSLTKNGLDLPALWERKRQTIEATPGLSVWRGDEKFAGIGGLENIKTFLSRVIGGAEPPRAIVFIDEIEKALAGASGGGDTSGVAQDQQGTLLSWMQDNNATGIICIGPPGTSKSLLAKATGNEAGIPTVALDFGAMKGSLVGESEQQLRGALKVISAIAGGRTLFLATCNSLSVLSPELRRRFTFGTFFFDLPTPDERAAIWALYARKYEIPCADGIKGDDNWTGAEIKQCCELAYRLSIGVEEAAAYIVPVARSAADQVEALRAGASGRFISASAPGVYQYDRALGSAPTTATTARPRRATQLED